MRECCHIEAAIIQQALVDLDKPRLRDVSLHMGEREFSSTVEYERFPPLWSMSKKHMRFKRGPGL